MHLKIRLLILILVLGLMLSACAASVPVEPEASSVETEMITEPETTVQETTTTETTSPEEERSEEETTEEETRYFHLGITDGILKYEDVRGYFFRTEFHEDWPQNDYDQTAFKMVDGRMTYEGKIVYNGMEYEFEVDAHSGTITDWDSESIYDD